MTATVDNVSLIAASIMSKKIAAGADAIVLDVKVGDGAFMKSLDDARILAETMLELGQRAGRDVVCLLTDMDQPLGRAVGNALEVREAIDDASRRRAAGLHRARARRLRAPARALRSRHRRGRGRGGARRRRSPTARRSPRTSAGCARRAATPSEDALPKAPVVREVFAPRGGYVQRLGALPVGLAALHLGAGRRTKDDAIDHAVGVVCREKRGDAVGAGEPLAEIHARDEASADEAVREVLAAYELGDEQPPARSIVLDVCRRPTA